MSAIGIDFGNENCYIAVAKAGGIEIISNDYSQRATPSYVAFGPTCRDLGTAAKNKFVTNLKNTICGFKRLIGKKFKDPVLQFELSYLPYVIHEMPNGSLGVKVSYLGHDLVFTLHQITAMLFTKLKNITETAIEAKITDCVVSVPIFFSDAERRALIDSCQIAGLNVKRLLNETTAVALAYGFYRQDFVEDKPRKVIFVDIGHSAVQATACAFTKGNLKILSSSWDFYLGGRDIDNAMVRHFSQEFKTKYNLNPLSNSRAIVRLLQECEKLKKQLSVNPMTLPLNIECFMDDIDVSSSLGRDQLEELCSDIMKRIEDVFIKLLMEAHLRPQDIGAVELVGGSTRIPAIKSIIKKIFGLEPSTTLNLDEAVARGCAIQAAMLSPSLKVKDFYISDIQPYSIKLVWNIIKTECGDIEVFPKNHPVPFSKLLTFFRKEDFMLKAYYSAGKKISADDVLIGSFLIKNVNELPSGDSAKIVVKLRVNVHGIFSVCSAVSVDRDFKDNVSLNQQAEDLMDVQGKSSDTLINAALNEEKRSLFFLKKTKKATHEVQLQVESKVPQLSESEMKTLIERESKMISQDRHEQERIDAKNELEEYVYVTRSRLSEDLKPFIDPQELNNFQHRLNGVENWIYEEGQDQTEAVYNEKLSELKVMCNPVLHRKREEEQRPAVLSLWHQQIEEASEALTSYLCNSQHYSHIEPKEMEQVQRVVDEKRQWLAQQVETLKKLKPYENPPVTVEFLNAEKEKLKQEIFPVLHKPRPQ